MLLVPARRRSALGARRSLTERAAGLALAVRGTRPCAAWGERATQWNKVPGSAPRPAPRSEVQTAPMQSATRTRGAVPPRRGSSQVRLAQSGYLVPSAGLRPALRGLSPSSGCAHAGTVSGSGCGGARPASPLAAYVDPRSRHRRGAISSST